MTCFSLRGKYLVFGTYELGMGEYHCLPTRYSIISGRFNRNAPRVLGTNVARWMRPSGHSTYCSSVTEHPKQEKEMFSSEQHCDPSLTRHGHEGLGLWNGNNDSENFEKRWPQLAGNNPNQRLVKVKILFLIVVTTLSPKQITGYVSHLPWTHIVKGQRRGNSSPIRQDHLWVEAHLPPFDSQICVEGSSIPSWIRVQFAYVEQKWWCVSIGD